MTTTKTPDSVQLFERRRWRRRIADSRRWIIAGAVVVLAAFVGWIVFVSSWLGVQAVRVEGGGVGAARVRAVADVAIGTPLARVSLSSVAARVEQIPAVASARVQRSWPHGLVIQVTPRRPVGTVERAGSWYAMDATGVLFARSSQPTTDEPVVDLQGTPPPGTRQEVGAVLGALTPTLRAETKSVTASSLDSITLHLTGGAEVRWGTADQSALKARVLHALMLHHHATFYDVSIPSEPATRG